jgi:hypothetical protein
MGRNYKRDNKGRFSGGGSGSGTSSTVKHGKKSAAKSTSPKALIKALNGQNAKREVRIGKVNKKFVKALTGKKVR